MAKATRAGDTPVKIKKAKLDVEGLGRLGIEKLTSLILEEIPTNRPLKNRIMAALAGLSGPEDAAKVIDKRLVSLENVQTSVKGIKARQLVDGVASLLASILSDIAARDSKLGIDLLIRFLHAEDQVRGRFRTDYPKLDQAYEEAASACVALAATLKLEDQQALAARVETLALRDPYGTWMKIARALIPVLKTDALSGWQATLRTKAKSVNERLTGAPLQAVELLQLMALTKNDLADYVALEEQKPRGRQDPMRCAQLLFEAGKYAEALIWVRIRKPAIPKTGDDHAASPSAPIIDLDQVKLEASILDAMKDRKAAQGVRWAAYASTLDIAILRDYIAKADDFTEFDELDKAFAHARSSGSLYPALKLLIEWPKLDQAAKFVVERNGQWDGRNFAVLTRAAENLMADYPLAATILLRSLVTTILERSISPAYEQAAAWYYQLSDLALRLEDPLPIPTHGTYILDLEKKHGRKFGFWGLLSGK